MQIKEFEAQTLKECLQLVRNAMGSDAVILETRKFRKGGVMGLGAHDAVAIVAATGITVDSDRRGQSNGRADGGQEPATMTDRPTPTEVDQPNLRRERSWAQTQSNQAGSNLQGQDRRISDECNHAATAADAQAVTPANPARSSAAHVAARSVYARRIGDVDKSREPQPPADAETDPYAALLAEPTPNYLTERMRRLAAQRMQAGVSDQPAGDARSPAEQNDPGSDRATAHSDSAPTRNGDSAEIRRSADEPAVDPVDAARSVAEDRRRLAYLEKAMGEIRECLTALKREQSDGIDRTVSAVVSAVAPAVTAVNAAGFAAYASELQTRFPELQAKLRAAGVSESLVDELFDQLPDMSAWSPKAQEALAISAVRDLMARRIAAVNTIELTPGTPKVVALIGPTGVGKTTTVAKLAANFALLQRKRVALVTVDTYRIAAVEQLKTYSQIIGLPVSVAYSHEELPAILSEYSDYDLVLIDTAGRSQRHATQIEELKALVATVDCEAHLVLAASTNEQDLIDTARRFAGARVDRIIFSKLDETSRFGALLTVADRTGIPLSFLTTGQKVPEDIEPAEPGKVADLILADISSPGSLLREAAGH